MSCAEFHRGDKPTCEKLALPRSGRGESRRALRILCALALAASVGACSFLRSSPPAETVPPPVAPAPVAATTEAAPPAAAAASGSKGASPVAPGGAPSATTTAPAVPAVPPVDPLVRAAFSEAVAALQAGRDDEAQRDFSALAKANPELGGPHANLGRLYLRAGKADEAVAELETAVKLGADEAPYWNQLGIAYRRQGRFEKAKEAYERAIALDPKYAMAKLNLGVLFDLYLWDAAHALEQYEQYLALTPGGDDKVSKWVADLRNRTRAQAAGAAPAGGKERE